MPVAPFRATRHHEHAHRHDRIRYGANALGDPTSYDPRWVFHGRLIGPPTDAAVFPENLLAGKVVSAASFAVMRGGATTSAVVSGNNRRAKRVDRETALGPNCCPNLRPPVAMQQMMHNVAKTSSLSRYLASCRGAE